MPCIIEKNICKNGGSLWVSYCGKNVWRHNKPHTSINDARMSHLPICKKCRRVSRIDGVTNE